MKIKKKILPFLLSLFIFSFHLPLEGNKPNSPPKKTSGKKNSAKGDSNKKSPSLDQKQISKLQKDLLRPEIAMIAATKLLEMKNKRAFAVVEKSFASANPDVQIQIIRAIGFKKDPRGLKVLMLYFSHLKTPKAVRREIGKTLELFTSHKEVLEYFISLLETTSPGYSKGIRELSLLHLRNMLRHTSPREALSQYHRILENKKIQKNGLGRAILRRAILQEIGKLVGHDFSSFEEWEKWWATHKNKSQLDWFREARKALLEKLSQSEKTAFFWWKKYLEAIETTDPKIYRQELLSSLAQNRSAQQTLYALQKLENTPSLKGEVKAKMLGAMIGLLKKDNNPYQIRFLAVQVLGKLSLNTPADLMKKSSRLLGQIFQNSLDIPLRIQACNALASLKSKETLPIFLKALNHPKEALEVVQEVIRNLGAFEETRDNAIVKAVLRRLEITYGNKIPLSSKINHMELLSLAIEKLGHFAYYNPVVLKKSTFLLKMFLRHDSMKIRYFASSSLGKIGTIADLPPLLTALQNSDRGVQRSILSAILSLLRKKAPPLKEAVQKSAIDSIVFCYKYPKLRKRTQKVLSQIIESSLVLLNYTLAKLQSPLKEKGGVFFQNSYQELAMGLLETLPSPIPPTIEKNDFQKKLYWKLKNIQARAYVSQNKGKEALKIYEGLPKPFSLATKIEVIQALLLNGETEKAEIALEEVEKKISSQNFDSHLYRLLRIFEIALTTNGSLAKKLFQKWENSSLWKGKAREKLLQIKKKFSPPHKKVSLRIQPPSLLIFQPSCVTWLH